MKLLGSLLFSLSLVAAVPSFAADVSVDARIEKADALLKAKDYEAAKTLIEPLALEGDAKAENLLGLYYFYTKHLEASCDWFEKAANQGLARGQYNLALCFDLGEGRPQSLDRAIPWYQKAADGGNKYAQMNYGTILLYGQGAVQNLDEGRRWLSASAGQGHLGAMYKLAQSYKDENRQLFLEWHRKAAQAGNMHSMLALDQEGDVQDREWASKNLTKEILACLHHEVTVGNMFRNFCTKP